MSPVSTSSISKSCSPRSSTFREHAPIILPLKSNTIRSDTEKIKNGPRRCFQDSHAIYVYIDEIKSPLKTTKKIEHIGCEEGLIVQCLGDSEIDLGEITHISIKDVFETSKKLEDGLESGSNLEGTKPAHINETLRLVGTKRLDFASYLNGGVLYMAMTLCAISGAGLLSWEQSPETPSFDPKVPMTLYWVKILCLLALPLSVTASDEIKQLAVQMRKCHEKTGDDAETTNQGTIISPGEAGKKRGRSGGGQADRDLEGCERSKRTCHCIRCMSKFRRIMLYGALYLAPFLTALAFTLSLASLAILMFATESHNIAKIAVMCCLPMKATFLGAMVWLAYRRWTHISED